MSAARMLSASWNLYGMGTKSLMKDRGKFMEQYRFLIHRVLNMASIVLTTCNNSATDDHSTGYKSDVALVDAVAQAAEIDVLIPLAMYPDAQRMVLVGDRKQLASVVPSEKGNEFAAQRSYLAFERFLDLGYQAELRTKNYRLTANINAFLAEHYYQDLKQCAPPVWDKIADAVRQ